MATEHNVHSYYVPEQSKLPIWASLALFLTVFGLGNLFNSIAAHRKAMENNPALEPLSLFGHDATFIVIAGFLLFVTVLYNWFSIVIDENMRGLNNAQLKRSYVWGMGWFIFSEVMFFSAFFGALWYVRNISLPHLSTGPTEEILWKGFQDVWPVMTTPDVAMNGESAKNFIGPGENMSNPGITKWGSWLPFYNTVILLASSFTVHFAHTALKNDKKSKFNFWLGFTVALGIIFLFVQAYEYHHAYVDLGLTLETGIYGTTFFMLTGFHGAHVTLGTFMLLVQWLRSMLKGHFNHHDCFGFEASSWYWHFVDVVWLGLFIFVYILG
jgi:cytochrome c oxidase subunit III